MKLEFSIKLVVAAIIVAWCALNAVADFIAFFQLWQYKSAHPFTRTTGKVLNLTRYDAITVVAEISYMVNGKEIKGWAPTPIPFSTYTVGQQIDVYYQNDRIENSTPYWFALPSNMALLLLAQSIILLFTIALVCYLYNHNMEWVGISIGIVMFVVNTLMGLYVTVRKIPYDGAANVYFDEAGNMHMMTPVGK